MLRFYFDVPNTSTVPFSLPLTPERISVSEGAHLQTFQILDLGTIAFPRGVEPIEITFDALLPGIRNQALPSPWEWIDPNFIVATLQIWKNTNQQIRFIVTETTINLDCFVKTLEWSHGSALGDIALKLVLTEARSITIGTVNASIPTANGQRTLPHAPGTYQTKPGDSLWLVAQTVYGDGARWGDILAANQASGGQITDDGAVLVPGTTLTIPGGVNFIGPVLPAPTISVDNAFAQGSSGGQ